MYSWFDWVQSDRVFCLEAGYVGVRITRRGKGATRFDYLDLVEQLLPVEENSWGRIKRLYLAP